MLCMWGGATVARPRSLRSSRLRGRRRRRLAIQNAAPIRADVYAAEDAWVSRDAAEACAVLVLVVVHAQPRLAGVVGPPDGFEFVARAHGEQRGVVAARRRFAEA